MSTVQSDLSVGFSEQGDSETYPPQYSMVHPSLTLCWRWLGVACGEVTQSRPLHKTQLSKEVEWARQATLTLKKESAAFSMLCLRIGATWWIGTGSGCTAWQKNDGAISIETHFETAKVWVACEKGGGCCTSFRWSCTSFRWSPSQDRTWWLLQRRCNRRTKLLAFNSCPVGWQVEVLSVTYLLENNVYAALANHVPGTEKTSIHYPGYDGDRIFAFCAWWFLFRSSDWATNLDATQFLKVKKESGPRGKVSSFIDEFDSVRTFSW